MLTVLLKLMLQILRVDCLPGQIVKEAVDVLSRGERTLKGAF